MPVGTWRVSVPDNVVLPTSSRSTPMCKMTVVVSLYVALPGPSSVASTMWMESQHPSLTNSFPCTRFLIKKHPANPLSKSHRYTDDVDPASKYSSRYASNKSLASTSIARNLSDGRNPSSIAGWYVLDHGDRYESPSRL